MEEIHLLVLVAGIAFDANRLMGKDRCAEVSLSPKNNNVLIDTG